MDRNEDVKNFSKREHDKLKKKKKKANRRLSTKTQLSFKSKILIL